MHHADALARDPGTRAVTCASRRVSAGFLMPSVHGHGDLWMGD
jgi:hypothetical protein